VYSLDGQYIVNRCVPALENSSKSWDEQCHLAEVDVLHRSRRYPGKLLPLNAQAALVCSKSGYQARDQSSMFPTVCRKQKYGPGPFAGPKLSNGKQSPYGSAAINDMSVVR
jgi:hypothetical protein